jgi:hypothetical protein
LRPISRLIVDGALPRRAAIERIDCPAISAREISSLVGADPILTHPADPILTRGWTLAA